jgi:hypothetical protein
MITLTREEAQQVLDALICSGPDCWSPYLVDQHNKALKTLRARLSEPEQEPVAFMYEFFADKGNRGLAFESQQYADNIPLYKAPPPCQTCVSLARAVMMDQFGRC